MARQQKKVVTKVFLKFFEAKNVFFFIKLTYERFLEPFYVFHIELLIAKRRGAKKGEKDIKNDVKRHTRELI